jgi:hypothetical protein
LFPVFYNHIHFVFMNRLVYIFIFCLSCFTTSAQHAGSWVWATADTAGVQNTNPGAFHSVTAVNGNKVFWGYPLGKKFLYGSDAMTDYQLAEYDTAAKQLHGIMVYGKLYFLDAQTDANGNWYLLGRYFDTMQFSGPHLFTRDAWAGSGPDYFIVRLNAGTLDFAWLQHIGADDLNTASTFTIKNNTLYMPIDSGGVATNIYKYDLSTGNPTLLWTQTGQSYTSSIQVDNSGNVYLAGSCAFTELDFNGHKITGPSSYPVYMVKYSATGTYLWSHFMSDVTCAARKLTLATDNILYYSGTLHDTMSLGGYTLHHPAWVYDFLVSRLDSNGNVYWVRQLKDTLSGDAEVDYQYHAAACADNSLSVFASVRRFLDWGNGVTTNNNGYGSAIINFSTAGVAQWAATIDADYTSTEHIISSGSDLYVVGYGTDSTAIQFGSIPLPAYGRYMCTPYMARLHDITPTSVPATTASNVSYSVSPNPAKETLYLSASNQNAITVRMIDISGRTVFENHYNKTLSHEAINVSNLVRGLYFIEFSDGQTKNIQRVILE